MLKLQFRDQPGHSIKLSHATLTLGRDQSNDVVIDSPTVSDFHAEISADAQNPRIVDLLSAHGTFVNDRRISDRCPLKAWDVVRLGTVELEVTDPNSRRPQDWVLRTESALLASQFFALQPKTIVGREPGCDLTIDSNMLSRRHAEIIIEGDHLKVVDMGSANGTYLNGEKIQEAIAWPGDELRFDKQRFIVIGPRRDDTAQREGDEDNTMLRTSADERLMRENQAEPTGPAPAPDSTDSSDYSLPPADDETRIFVPPPPTAVLAEMGDDGDERRFELDNATQQVGRGQGCDIVLTEKSVSKRHAEFTYEQGAWCVRDLGSSNGVLVNGERIDKEQLKSGDRLKLGRLEFSFSVTAEAVEDGDSPTMIFQSATRGTAGDHSASAQGKTTYSRLWWLVPVLVVLLAAAALSWFGTGR